MIRSIRLNNFQSHKDTAIELVPGINVITGMSDCGKTAILRALNWVINNRPAGDAFRSSWGGDTSVTVETDDTFVQRVKNDKKNEYQILDKCNEEEAMIVGSGWGTFKAMGMDVPQDVTQALNLGAVNVQYQMDAPFMLSLTPGEAGRQLNQVVNLEVIDRTVSKVNGFVRQAAADRTRLEAEVDGIRAELAGFSYIEQAEAQLTKIERDAAALSDLRSRHGKISALISQIEAADAEVKRYAYLSGAVEALAKIDRTIQARNALAAAEAKLNKVLYDIASAEDRISGLGDVAAQKERLDAIIARHDAADVLYEEHKRLSQVVLAIGVAERDVDDAIACYDAAKKEYDKILPEVCPLCGNPMKK